MSRRKDKKRALESLEQQRKDKEKNEHRTAKENSGSTGPGSSARITTPTYLTRTPYITGASTFPTYTSSLTSFSYLTYRGTLSGAPSPSVELPVEKGDEPFKAWKIAMVTFLEDGKLEFTGVTGMENYHVEDVAKCAYRLTPLHIEGAVPPVVDCQCGFYGMKNKSSLDASMRRYEYQGNSSMALLEVEFYGKVIECEHGYRAEKQRVLSVCLLRPRNVCAWVGSELTTWGTTRPAVCKNEAVIKCSDGKCWCDDHFHDVETPKIPDGPFETEVTWLP